MLDRPGSKALIVNTRRARENYMPAFSIVTTSIVRREKMTLTADALKDKVV